MTQNHFHSQPVQETVRQLDAQLATGLTHAEVQQRLREYGENALPESKKTPLWRLLWLSFKTLLC